jgi:hypothetical protein
MLSAEFPSCLTPCHGSGGHRGCQKRCGNPKSSRLILIYLAALRDLIAAHRTRLCFYIYEGQIKQPEYLAKNLILTASSRFLKAGSFPDLHRIPPLSIIDRNSPRSLLNALFSQRLAHVALFTKSLSFVPDNSVLYEYLQASQGKTGS